MRILVEALTGRMNARAVQANAPVKLINKPNLGIIRADRPVAITIKLLRTMFLVYGYSELGLGIALKQFVASVIYSAGMTSMGYEPSRPMQYSNCTDVVSPSCGKFNVTMSLIS